MDLHLLVYILWLNVLNTPEQAGAHWEHAPGIYINTQTAINPAASRRACTVLQKPLQTVIFPYQWVPTSEVVSAAEGLDLMSAKHCLCAMLMSYSACAM